MNYQDFLASKKIDATYNPIEHGEIHDSLFPFQKEVVKKLLKIGRAAAFLDTGLGKTIIQCEWARHVPGPVLILAPLAVAQQTIEEARKLLGLKINYSKDGVRNGKITITNYERLSLFDLSEFTGVVLDESSILKGFMSKTKQALCEGFANTPYKLACTATPAPNDHMELGNHSEFLGVMPGTEMLTRWFINDPAHVGAYRLKGHAVGPFWEWVASWAACVSMPSDLGYSDDGYALPPLTINTHTVTSPLLEGGDGELFSIATVSATDIHATKRLTLDERCERVSELVNSSKDPWIVWCESNLESELLAKLIPDGVEVKGSDTIENKEDRMMAFAHGKARVLISKPSICGYGMNFQHCNNMAFASISYSYESFYQAVRRSWRFGQNKPVNVHVFISDAELPVWRTIERKSLDHDSMKSGMKLAIGAGKTTETKIDYNPTKKATMPKWMERSNS